MVVDTVLQHLQPQLGLEVQFHQLQAGLMSHSSELMLGIGPR